MGLALLASSVTWSPIGLSIPTAASAPDRTRSNTTPMWETTSMERIGAGPSAIRGVQSPNSVHGSRDDLVVSGRGLRRRVEKIAEQSEINIFVLIGEAIYLKLFEQLADNRFACQ